MGAIESVFLDLASVLAERNVTLSFTARCFWLLLKAHPSHPWRFIITLGVRVHKPATTCIIIFLIIMARHRKIETHTVS